MTADPHRRNVEVWLYPLITCLDSTFNRWLLVILSAVLGTIFMNLYNPLTIQKIIIYSDLGNFLTIRSAAVVGAISIAFTQFVVRPLLGIKTFSVFGFTQWIVFELLFLNFVIYMIYREYEELALNEFLIVIKYAVGIAIPPYIAAILLILLKDTISSRDDMHSGTSNSSDPSSRLSVDYLNIRDNNGKERLIVKTDNLLYLEAKNNYVEVNYVEGSEIKQKLVRNTLKSLEQELDHPTLLRVHRSFVTNLKNINSVERKGTKWTIKLAQLHHVEIPVSTTYHDSLQEAMSLKSSTTSPQ